MELPQKPVAEFAKPSNRAEIRFRLYVAGNLPNSRRAVANLRAFCLEYLPDRNVIEIRDVFEVPEQAIEDRISLTPQLLVDTREGVMRIAGDLSDRAVLIEALANRGIE